MIVNKSSRTSVRCLLLSLLLLISGSSLGRPVIAAISDSVSRVVIEKRRVVIVRKGQLARDFPERKRAVINYPVVKGPQNSEVLRKVRSILNLKNVFETSLEEYRKDTWLTEFDYQINYNQNYILDITFTQSGVGAYPDTQTKHFAINLKTGELIKAADAFNPPSLEPLAALLDKKLQAEIKQTLKENPEEKDNAESLFGGLRFKVENLDDFSISNKGVTFLYDAGFPHVVQALQPVGRYFLSYAALKPHIKRAGPLGIFIR